MDFLPDICQIPEILRVRKLDPVKFYTDPEINWDKQQYNAYAKNRRKLSPGQMYKVSIFFGIPMEELYTWKEVKSRKGTGKNQNSK